MLCSQRGFSFEEGSYLQLNAARVHYIVGILDNQDIATALSHACVSGKCGSSVLRLAADDDGDGVPAGGSSRRP